MPPRKRAESKVAEQVAAKEEASSLAGTEPDEPPHEPPVSTIEGDGASNDLLPGQGDPDDGLNAPVKPEDEPDGPVGMLADEPDLVMDAADAQPSDPTRCGGYVLVEGQGWRPASKE